MSLTTIEDITLIEKAYKMKHAGILVSEISNRLSVETGQKITQMALWRLFDSLKEETQKELLESDYPSIEDISYLFNKKVQKEKNLTLIKYRDETIRRDLMIRILNGFYKKEFTYMEVKIECKDRDKEENFMAHWRYLLDLHYIEKVDEYKFKFCERVKKWKVGFF